MHKVSRSLLLAGVLAFGTLAAACGDESVISPVGVVTTPVVTSVLVSPPSATINVGTSIILAAQVTADAAATKTVTWSSSNNAVATVSATGSVTGVAAGTVTIIATSTADATKQSAAVITVNAVTPPTQVQPPSITINGVTDLALNQPVNLGNVNGQINVTVNLSNTVGQATVDLFLSSCSTTTIAAGETPVASQTTTAAQTGSITLSINTASLTAANAPRFANGQYCIKARLTNGSTVVTAANITTLNLNNTNQFASTITFASVTGGPNTATSTINGLNYRQGTITLTLTPVIFQSAIADSLITGYLTRNGEVNGVATTAANNRVVFTNATVSSGVATIVFTDTGSTAGSNSVFGYTSLPAGDTIYITSAIDRAGNPITVTPTGTAPGFVAQAGFGGIRIDNDVPALAGGYTVTATNGYVGTNYVFSSGTNAAAPASDVKAGVAGVGVASTVYYVGAASSTSFTTANSCTITGLLPVTSANDLTATTSITPDKAKVVVTDLLGNKSCQDVGVTTTSGFATTFGVDLTAPTIQFVPPTLAGAPSTFSNNNGAAATTAYNVTKNFSLSYTDPNSGSGFTNATTTTPLRGTLTRNAFVANTVTTGAGAAGGVTAGCVIGTYTSSTGACAPVAITPTSTLSAGGNAPPYDVNSIEITNGTATPGYYLLTVTASDLALNASAPVSRLVAFDNVIPTVGALTQSPTSVAGLGSLTVTATAADNLDLASSRGSLSYGANTPAPFQAVAGTSFGPNFDATLVTSAPASVTFTSSTLYRGIQTTTGAAGTINADRVGPSASITVTDVGGNNSAAAAATTVTVTGGANILTTGGITFTTFSTNPAPATSQTSTTITANVNGNTADPNFQSQPFAQVDLYKLTGGELVAVAGGTSTSPITTDITGARTYSYQFSGVALTAASTNTFYAIGRNAAGDAVISQAITVVNP